MQWPEEFYAHRRGDGCPMCAEGRPVETVWGARVYGGAVSDAYLQRNLVQRGYTVVIWRGRHVVEPMELSAEDAASYWRELLLVAGALERHFDPVKMNFEILGNSLPHLHTHVVPRYADDPKPGWPFPFPDEQPPIPEAEFAVDVAGLRALLGHEG